MLGKAKGHGLNVRVHAPGTGTETTQPSHAARRTPLRRRAVAFLELLAAPARAGVVATHTGVGIGRKGWLSRPAPPPTLNGAWDRRAVVRRNTGRNQPVGRSFRRHHRRLTSSRTR